MDRAINEFAGFIVLFLRTVVTGHMGARPKLIKNVGKTMREVFNEGLLVSYYQFTTVVRV